MIWLAIILAVALAVALAALLVAYEKLDNAELERQALLREVRAFRLAYGNEVDKFRKGR